MSTHIQIGDIAPRIQYTGDGLQTVFTYPFPIFADADMEVYEGATLMIITTHYTVSGAGNSAGGSVTFVTAPANGVLVTLRRQMAIKRTTDFQESGEFRAKVINDELDIATAGLQQVETEAKRGLKLSATDPADTLTLPEKAARSSKFLGFDANGDAIAAAGSADTVTVSGFMATVVDDADAASARATLGLGTAAVKNTGTSGNAVPLLDGANTWSGDQNLSDKVLQRPELKDVAESVNAIGSMGGGTQDIDLTLGNYVTGTVDTSATTLTFSNPPASGKAGSFTLVLTNGGSQTVNWPASVKWAGGTAPALTAAGADVLVFTTSDGGATWYGFAAGLGMQ